MKIQIINLNKIRVEINDEDLSRLNISAERLKPDSPELHDFLFHILESIREETGFNPYSGQVVVEAACCDCGITLTISSLAEKKELSKQEKDRIRKAKPVLKRKTVRKMSGFSFSDFKTLIEACKHLEAEDIRKSTIYKYRKGYYLYFKGNMNNERAKAVLCEFCDLYGERVHGIDFVREHGEMVADGRKLEDICANIKIMNLF